SSKSAVIVLKVRTSLCGCLPAPGTTTQANTVCLWMSSPQQRSYITSTTLLRLGAGRSGVFPSHRLCCACFLLCRSNTRWCLGTTHVRFFAGSQHQRTSTSLRPVHGPQGNSPNPLSCTRWWRSRDDSFFAGERPSPAGAERSGTVRAADLRAAVGRSP